MKKTLTHKTRNMIIAEFKHVAKYCGCEGKLNGYLICFDDLACASPLEFADDIFPLLIEYDCSFSDLKEVFDSIKKWPKSD